MSHPWSLSTTTPRYERLVHRTSSRTTNRARARALLSYCFRSPEEQQQLQARHVPLDESTLSSLLRKRSEDNKEEGEEEDCHDDDDELSFVSALLQGYCATGQFPLSAFADDDEEEEEEEGPLCASNGTRGAQPTLVVRLTAPKPPTTPSQTTTFPSPPSVAQGGPSSVAVPPPPPASGKIPLTRPLPDKLRSSAAPLLHRPESRHVPPPPPLGSHSLLSGPSSVVIPFTSRGSSSRREEYNNEGNEEAVYHHHHHHTMISSSSSSSNPFVTAEQRRLRMGLGMDGEDDEDLILAASSTSHHHQQQQQGSSLAPLNAFQLAEAQNYRVVFRNGRFERVEVPAAPTTGGQASKKGARRLSHGGEEGSKKAATGSSASLRNKKTGSKRGRLGEEVVPGDGGRDEGAAPAKQHRAEVGGVETPAPTAVLENHEPPREPQEEEGDASRTSSRQQYHHSERNVEEDLGDMRSTPTSTEQLAVAVRQLLSAIPTNTWSPAFLEALQIAFDGQL